MIDESASRRRALAFNAVGPAVNEAGCWLPFSARRTVADAVLAAIADPAAGYCPHCGRGDTGPTADQYEQQRKRAEKVEAALARIRDAVALHRQGLISVHELDAVVGRSAPDA